jgi:hypothetical protein
MESLDCSTLTWKGGHWCRCGGPSRWNHLGVRRLSWFYVHERACLSSDVARHSISSFAEISLKPLLTPDKWTNLTIFCIYMQNMKTKCKNMQENMQNMQENMQQYAKKIQNNMQNTPLSICRICRIWIVRYFFAYYFAYSAYCFAYFYKLNHIFCIFSILQS